VRYRIRLRGFVETALLAALDLAVVLLLFELSYFARVEVLPRFFGGFPEELPVRDLSRIWWVFLIWVFFFSYEGLYTKRFAFWDEVKALWKAAFFATVGIFTITSVGQYSGEVSRTVVTLMGVASVAALPIVRMPAKAVLRKAGFLKRRVLVLGAGRTGELVVKALKKESNFGYEVKGFLDDDPAKVGSSIQGVKVHRGVDSAEKYLRRCGITDLVIAMPGAGKQRLQGLIDRLQHKVDRMLYVPDVFGMAVVGTTLQHFFEEQAFALEVKNNLAQPVNFLTKRVFDYAVALALLVLFAAPLLLIAMLIKATSRGPVIYRHRRMGRNGRPFDCFKFRTMYADAGERLKEILAMDAGARAEWEARRKLANDPRVTALGGFLRKTSLDELPQLLNVLLGEMSLVGPRPVTGGEIEKYYRDAAELCFGVMPGITGLWQVSGRSDTDYGYRVALDAWYVRNWDLWLDVVILLRTLAAVFRKEGAR